MATTSRRRSRSLLHTMSHLQKKATRHDPHATQPHSDVQVTDDDNGSSSSGSPLTSPVPAMTSLDTEVQAFLAWLNALDLTRTVHSVNDISDGTVLADLLFRADSAYFPMPARQLQPDDAWPLRLTTLKSLYRRISQYYVDIVTRQPGFTPPEEFTPDLQAIVKESDEKEATKFLRLAIGVAVQGDGKREAVECIRELKEEYQTSLMRSIELVMKKFPPSVAVSPADTTMTDDDHYYQIQSARSRLQSENGNLKESLAALTEQNRQFQNQRDDLQGELEELRSTVNILQRQAEERKNDGAEAAMRKEIDRLKSELQKSEDNLTVAESQLAQRESEVNELHHTMVDLQEKAEEAVRLKDQVDEWRHTAERYQKNENVIEKYKKKLEETADLRRQIKALTEQNTHLINTNSQMEAEHAKVANFKPLLEAYKSQIADLEEKSSRRATEIESMRVQMEEEKTKRREVERLRERERREAEEWAARVRELEGQRGGLGQNGARLRWNGLHGEGSQADDDAEIPLSPDLDIVADSLDDALSGTTMTDLKLRIRSLERQLEDSHANRADASRIMVLENLLEDANRMKTRYEKDYLAAHREALIAKKELDDIRSGKVTGNASEVVIALRQRLNELVEELDTLKKTHEEQSVELEAHRRDLTIAQSDLNLVNKDQLDILASLRESVNVDKAELEREVERMRTTEKELRDKNRMQLEQVNTLLMEKVELQGEGIGQREALLRRERDISDLRASVAGKDLPEEAKSRLLSLHEENISLKDQIKTLQQKLATARAFIKEQDALFNKQHAGKVDPSTFLEAEESYKAQISSLEETIQSLRRALKESEDSFRKERTRMTSAFQAIGQERRSGHQPSRSGPRPDARGWLEKQRNNLLIGR